MSKAAVQRINVLLPSPTLRLLDDVAPPGRRSQLIDEAVRFFVRSKGRAELRRLLREGAEKRAARDRNLADEWFLLEDRG